MERFIVFLLIVGCHVETKRDVVRDEQLNAQQQEQLKAQRDTNEVKAQAESGVSTKTSSDNNAVEVQGPDGEITLAVVTPKTPQHFPRGSRVIGTVPLSHHEVDQNKTIGAKTDTKAETDNLDKTTNTDLALASHLVVHEEKEKDVGPGWKFYLWISLGAALFLAGAWAALKFYFKPAWLPRWL